jgi:hypothetical protein
MTKFEKLLNGLKTISKFGVYALAIFKIVEFAIKTIEDLDPKEPKDVEVISE